MEIRSTFKLQRVDIETDINAYIHTYVCIISITLSFSWSSPLSDEWSLNRNTKLGTKLSVIPVKKNSTQISSPSSITQQKHWFILFHQQNELTLLPPNWSVTISVCTHSNIPADIKRQVVNKHAARDCWYCIILCTLPAQTLLTVPRILLSNLIMVFVLWMLYVQLVMWEELFWNWWLRFFVRICMHEVQV